MINFVKVLHLGGGGFIYLFYLIGVVLEYRKFKLVLTGTNCVIFHPAVDQITLAWLGLIMQLSSISTCSALLRSCWVSVNKHWVSGGFEVPEALMGII